MDAHSKSKRLVFGLMVVAALCAVLGSAALASTEQIGAPAIPPGREEALAKILGRGAALPDGCELFSVLINQKVVDAEYNCTSGKVVFDVVHPSEATDDDLQTARFAIGLKNGTPPESLKEAIAAVMRAEERSFEWIWPEAEARAAVADEEAEAQ